MGPIQLEPMKHTETSNQVQAKPDQGTGQKARTGTLPEQPLRKSEGAKTGACQQARNKSQKTPEHSENSVGCFGSIADCDLILGRQPITCAPNGFDHHAGSPQGLAQAFDMHIDRALLDEHMVAPHFVQQL